MHWDDSAFTCQVNFSALMIYRRDRFLRGASSLYALIIVLSISFLVIVINMSFQT